MYFRLKNVALSVGFVLLALAGAVDAQQKGRGPLKSGFRPLFNGKDLTGWVRVNTAESTWKVKDGMLVCSGKPIGELRTTKMYQNFILELEWRHMKPAGNAGVFVWADDITAKGVPFHRSIEVQVLENAYGNSRGHTVHGDIFPIHGAKMTPINGRGGSRAFPTELRSKPSPQWNHYRIHCQDGEISLAVNGKVVTRGRSCSPRKGYICLESEGGIVHYRNVNIKELPDAPVSKEHIAIANRGYRCLYNGIDLDNWKASSSGSWATNDWRLLRRGKATSSSSLELKEKLGDYGFVLDLKLGKQGAVSIHPRGDERALSMNQDGGEHGIAVGKPGRWHRIEGTIRGGQIELTVDGKPIRPQTLEKIGNMGPLRIVATGEVELANIYVRQLQAKSK